LDRSNASEPSRVSRAQDEAASTGGALQAAITMQASDKESRVCFMGTPSGTIVTVFMGLK
jgi:hypothetical protein